MKRSKQQIKDKKKVKDFLIERKIKSDPVSLSRWLALMNGVSEIDKFERKARVPQNNTIQIDYNHLMNYVDRKSPAIENLIRNS